MYKETLKNWKSMRKIDKNYVFDFKKTPDQTISELFGHDIDAKLANILYVGHIPEKDILNLESNKILYNTKQMKIDSVIASNNKLTKKLCDKFNE